MDFVLENGWHVVATSEIVDWLEGEGELPEKAVTLHFDNVWLDSRTVVMPVLDELGATGTCYVMSELTDALLSQHYRSLRRWTFDQPPVWDFTVNMPYEPEDQIPPSNGVAR